MASTTTYQLRKWQFFGFLTVVLMLQLFLFDRMIAPNLSKTVTSSEHTANISIEKLDSSNYIDIFFCCDEISRPGLYTIINSIIINHKFILNEYIYFHILVESNTTLFLTEFEILFQHILKNNSIYIMYEFQSFMNHKSLYTFFDEYRRNDTTTHNIHNQYIFKVMNYARFYLPSIFPNVIGNAIYLDVDMIVLDDISGMYYQNNKCILHGVYNSRYTELFYMNNTYGLKLLGIDLNENKGFNAGGVVYNITHWRLNNYTKRYENIMKLNKMQKHDIFNLGTQPIMNVLYNHVVWRQCQLEKWWNCIGFGSDKI
eukprot:443573_1